MNSNNKSIQHAVREIALPEIEAAAKTLSSAFINDPLMLWIFGDQESYHTKSIACFKTWVKYCVLYGKAFRTENFESIALRKCPYDAKLTFWHMLRAGMLKTPNILGKQAFKRLMLFDEASTKARQSNLGKQTFWYCWMLGTQPHYQRQGFANQLVKFTFDLARQEKLPCYLETASEDSKNVHLKCGYKLLSKFILPDTDIKVFTMIKENNSSIQGI